MMSDDQAKVPKRWARVSAAEAHGLRRGAWYAVVNDARPLVVLDVNKRHRPVNREYLEFREGPPDRWSVVQRNPTDLPAKRASGADLEATYGVCPRCYERSNLVDGEPRLKCMSCGEDSEVDWSNPC
jgi:hypothetical protein